MSKLEVFLSLDVLSISKAIKIASEAYEEGIRHIEVGTPLIKSEGVKAIRMIRDAFPDAIIFADMKTMDTGGLEARIAFDNGADISSVMAVAPESTWKSAVEEAKKRGKEILLDLLGISKVDVVEKLKRAEEIGVDRVCLHRGIDEGGTADPNIMRELKKGYKILIGAAGGIDERSISNFLGLADFVMVGRAITGSNDVKGSVRRILSAIGIKHSIH
ncbi:MAG: orotidine 5'-phosphate decarboxylase / HUMPS family protein [Candidatus Methanodesulfokora sp.]